MRAYSFGLLMAITSAIGTRGASAQAPPNPSAPTESTPVGVNFRTAPGVSTEFTVLALDGRPIAGCTSQPDGACDTFAPPGTYLGQVRGSGRFAQFIVQIAPEGAHVSFSWDPVADPAPPPPPDRSPRIQTPRVPYEPHETRAEVGLAGSVVAPTGSAYGTLIAPWGFHFGPLEQLALRAVVRFRGQFVLGGRLAYTAGGGGSARDDQASLSMRDYEVGGVLGYVFEHGSTRAFFRLGFEAEVGLALLYVDLRGAEVSAVVPRLALAGSVGFGVHPHAPRFSLRGGFQYVPYGGAGSGSADPAFAGVFIGLSVDQLL